MLEGDGVGVMCRNHRGFVEALVALSKLGADAMLLNTAFAGPQLTEVVKREKPRAIIYDAEFSELLAGRAVPPQGLHRVHGRGRGGVRPTLDELIEGGDPITAAPARPRGPPDDPHVRHDRHAEGRLARVAGIGAAVAILSDPAARRARRCWSRRRCSTSGGSRTSGWRC